MKNIAYYISDYGYGHASRSIAIMRKLLENRNLNIIVCHSFALPFIKASINCNRISYREIGTDIGYFLEKDSIFPDKIQLLEQYKKFTSNWESKIKKEQKFLSDNRVDLVLSDISPLPFEAARNLGIPSVGISNFTWYSAYHGLIDHSELLLLKNAYSKMDYFFSLAGSKEKWDISIKEYGYFSREVNLREVDRIRQWVNPENNKSIIFLGLGMKIDVASLEQLSIWNSPNCVFLVSSNVNVNYPNVYQISRDYLESQNFIAASDLVISKAGWGIIGEALSADVPLLILNRPSMKEDQNTIDYLIQRNLCKTINWEEFKTYHINLSIINELKSSIKKNSSYHQKQIEKIVADLMKISNMQQLGKVKKFDLVRQC
ncbi:glycosyltransferase family protein [Neobacillus sedimentimangrovi]|uniref:glycosyltransferase family protein n=1 Tax=Neobacillus sedimentimangrovi TaxID=2699460 RepID=UPI0013D81123|nr:glycosyltransferase family protein [Neobacillus sedimentimangrovi]